MIEPDDYHLDKLQPQPSCSYDVVHVQNDRDDYDFDHYKPSTLLNKKSLWQTRIKLKTRALRYDCYAI